MEEKRKAGRPPGSRNKQTLDVKEAAQEYTAEALEKLADLMRSAQSEAAQVAAIKELLDRGHGKAKQAVDLEANVKADVRVVERRIVDPQA